MTTLNFYHLALVTHIIGFTIMAGITLADFVTTKQFWKQYVNDKPKAIAINGAMAKFPKFFGIGIILLILSGVTMMAITNGAFGEQTWFRIKFGLVILIIVNGLAIGRRQGTKLRKLLSPESRDENSDAKLLKIRSRLNTFHISQITLFTMIFVLSAFKFN
jgi:uncharacterized membrane protein SirB2